MSREQWGHGFNAGIKAQKKNKSHLYITIHKNGRMGNAGKVLEERDDGTLTVEWVDYLDLCAMSGVGGSPGGEVNSNMVGDYVLTELPQPVFHATWHTVMQEFIKDYGVHEDVF